MFLVDGHALAFGDGLSLKAVPSILNLNLDGAVASVLSVAINGDEIFHVSLTGIVIELQIGVPIIFSNHLCIVDAHDAVHIKTSSNIFVKTESVALFIAECLALDDKFRNCHSVLRIVVEEQHRRVLDDDTLEFSCRGKIEV